MKASLLLRIAAVLVFVHAVLHTIGGVFGGAAPGAQETAATAMKANQFVAMGVMRTYWDFFMGFGLWVSVSLVVMAVVLWQLGSLVKTDAAKVRPIVMTFFVGFLAFVWLGWRYFFVAPVVFEGVVALCLLGAWVLAGREGAYSRG